MSESIGDKWLAPLLERDLIPKDCLAALLVGSAARGWHDERSDFDIYIVTRTERKGDVRNILRVPLNPPRLHSEVFYREGRRWEVTYWLESQVDQMFSKISWEEYERGGAAGEILSQREELALGRLDFSVPLLGTAWLAASRDRLAKSAFQSILVARSLGSADSQVEDALGQMDAGNLESATISARDAFDDVIDALLLASGDYGCIAKWRPRRFKIVAPSFLSFEAYWAYETMRDYDPSDPARWITEVLAVCQEITMQIQLP